MVGSVICKLGRWQLLPCAILRLCLHSREEIFYYFRAYSILIPCLFSSLILCGLLPPLGRREVMATAHSYMCYEVCGTQTALSHPDSCS